MRRRLLFFILISASMLWAINYLALNNGWYEDISWIDCIAHSLGGFVVALSFMWMFLRNEKVPKMAKNIGFVFFVGFAWEVFEVYKGMMHLSDMGYYLDTASDLFFDIFGAYLATLFANNLENK